MNRSLLAALLATPALAFAQTPAAPAPAPAAPAAPAAAPAPAPAARPAAEAKAAAAIAVVDAKVATAVADREPQGAAESFPASVGKIYCWTKVTAPAGSEITHVWYRGAEKVNEVKLQLKQPTTRTWSVKTVPAEWVGDWKVEVVGPDGAVLQTVAFKVG